MGRVAGGGPIASVSGPAAFDPAPSAEAPLRGCFKGAAPPADTIDVSSCCFRSTSASLLEIAGRVAHKVSSWAASPAMVGRFGFSWAGCPGPGSLFPVAARGGGVQNRSGPLCFWRGCLGSASSAE